MLEHYAVAAPVIAAIAWLTLLSVATGADAQTTRPAAVADEVGATQVLKWKDGKRAAFLLQFDDSVPSHIATAIPELEKRQLIGTFYVCPGSKHYLAHADAWKRAAASPSVVLANHTYTHVGATSVEQMRDEIAKCDQAIRALLPAGRPKLMAFARPGGRPWTPTPEETDAVLTEHHLVRRPPFAGPPAKFNTTEAMLAAVDKTVADGEMGHIDFHGVGGDWLVAPVESYLAVLDRLVAERERVWVTDLVSWRQYVAERDASAVTTQVATDAEVRLTLSTPGLDLTLYDLPLTLRTRVPAGWSKVVVTQGQTRREVPVVDQLVTFDAVPGELPIVLTPAR